MPSFEYFLVEKTTLSVVIEAADRDEADAKVEELLYEGDLDWGLGDMETDYEFNGEIENA